MTVKQIVEIDDHSGEGHDRLHQQYKDPVGTLSVPSIGPDLVTGWRALLNALIVPAQEFEDIANQMLNERGITTAEGVNLDRIGQIVGLDRSGQPDEQYATFIVLKVAENNSDTTARDLLGIASILLGPDLIAVSIKEVFPAKAIIDYFVEVTTEVTVSNNQLEVYTDLGGGSPALPVVIPPGNYFPHELQLLIEDLVTAAWGEQLSVDFTALREFTFLIDIVPVLIDPAIDWGTAGPVYGFAVDQVIDATITGDPIPGPDYDPQNVQDAVESAKAAGVDVGTEAIALGGYFGFSTDSEALGWGSIVPVDLVIGGGTYTSLVT